MNVGPNDLAILVHPRFPINKDKICNVIQRIPVSSLYPENEVWWLCKFPTNIYTSEFNQYGLIPYASIEDKCLRKLAGPDIDIGNDECKELLEELTI